MLLVTILPASYRMFVPVANQVESNSANVDIAKDQKAGIDREEH
jgi:hypothetical protein